MSDPMQIWLAVWFALFVMGILAGNDGGPVILVFAAFAMTTPLFAVLMGVLGYG